MPKEIVGFFINKDFAVCSDNRNPKSNSGEDVLRWLASFNSLNIVYHLDFSFSCLLARLHLKKGQLETLQTQQKLWIEPEFQLTYIPEKYFAIRNGKAYESPYAMFADASQLNIQADINAKDLNDCWAKSKEAQAIGQKFYDTFQNCLKISCDGFISPINQFSKHFLKRFKGIPLVDDLPEEAIGEYFYYTARGGWFENYKKGYWSKGIYDLDLNSAYPSMLANFPDLNEGEWNHVTQRTDAPIGCYKGKWTITSTFSPIMYKTTPDDRTYDTEKQTNNPNVCPTGTWESYATTQEIDFVQKWKLGDFEVEDGFEWSNPKQIVYPWRKLIERLYAIKQTSTGLQRDIIKRVLNGLFGLTLQSYGGKFGDFFQPVYGSMIEVSTRLKLADLLLKNSITPIQIMVDGIVVDRMPDIIDIGDGLGQWKVAHKDAECIAVNAEVCAISGKDSGLPFAVTENWLKSEIDKNPDEHIYTMTQRSFVSLGKALNSNMIDQLGDIIESPRSLDLTDDTKRLFREMPQSGRELVSGKIYDSIPLPIEMIELSQLPKTDDEFLDNTLLTNV